MRLHGSETLITHHVTRDHREKYETDREEGEAENSGFMCVRSPQKQQYAVISMRHGELFPDDVRL